MISFMAANRTLFAGSLLLGVWVLFKCQGIWILSDVINAK